MASFGLPPSPYDFSALDDVFVFTNPKIDPTTVAAIPDRFGLNEGQDWATLVDTITARNRDSEQTGETFKIIYLARHGEGWHNVAEAKYGTKAWDDKWAMETGDDELTWAPDPELTAEGERQAREAQQKWKALLASKDAGERPPLPTKMFASPLARSANTLHLTYDGILWQLAADAALHPARPFIHEGLRENFSDRHTCDGRSKRSVVAARWEPHGWTVDPAMPEDDELFRSDYVETPEMMSARVRDALAVIWDTCKDDIAINITSHSGTMQALFRALRTVDFKPKTGGMVTMVVKATRRKSK